MWIPGIQEFRNGITFFFLLALDDEELGHLGSSLLPLVDGICDEGCNDVGDNEGISSI